MASFVGMDAIKGWDLSSPAVEYFQVIVNKELIRLKVLLESWLIEPPSSFEGFSLQLDEEEVKNLIGRNNKSLLATLIFLRDGKEKKGFFQLFQLKSDTPHLDQILAESKKMHKHSGPEIRLILSGQGTFTIFDQEESYSILVKQGTLISIPAECPHTFEPTGDGSIVALSVFQAREDEQSLPS